MRIAGEALTFDDVSWFRPIPRSCRGDVSLATRLTRDIDLRIPSSRRPLDTVTEGAALARAQQGARGDAQEPEPGEQAARCGWSRNTRAGGQGPDHGDKETSIREVLALTVPTTSPASRSFDGERSRGS